MSKLAGFVSRLVKVENFLKATVIVRLSGNTIFTSIKAQNKGALFVLPMQGD